MGDGIDDPTDADYMNTRNRWFPGYAINLETGERLNIGFGENSALTGQNSTDMKFNPTSTTGLDANGRWSWGGMHTIWVFNKTGVGTNDVPTYDDGAKIRSLMQTGSSSFKRFVFKAAIWTCTSVVAKNHSALETETKVRLRVNKNYAPFLSVGATATNASNPKYKVEVPGNVVPTTGVMEKSESAIDYIRVVPNPYYAYSTYEKTRKDQLDTRVRITNLPSKCVGFYLYRKRNIGASV